MPWTSIGKTSLFPSLSHRRYFIRMEVVLIPLCNRFSSGHTLAIVKLDHNVFVVVNCCNWIGINHCFYSNYQAKLSLFLLGICSIKPTNLEILINFMAFWIIFNKLLFFWDMKFICWCKWSKLGKRVDLYQVAHQNSQTFLIKKCLSGRFSN